MLRVGYQTARLLTQKFRRSMNSELLEGRVEVGHSDIPFRGAGSFLDPAKSGKIIVAAAMSSLEIRLAAIPDDSAASIEAFVRSNVKPGATLPANSYPFLTIYDHDPPRCEETPRLPTTFRLLRGYRRRRREPVDTYLDKFVVYHNDRHRQVSFDTLLRIASHHEPMSHWDIVGRNNPRKGDPTTRRQPRHRKTATGMRQDGSENRAR
jgi:hypothetical protein